MKNTAPEQRKIMRFLPLVFGVVLAVGGFPAGLFVYWVSSNLISIVQNLIIYRNAPKIDLEAKKGPDEMPGEKRLDDYRPKTDAGTTEPAPESKKGSGGAKSGKRKKSGKRR